MSRSASAFREWSVVGLGVCLLAVSLSYFAVGGELLSAEFVRFAAPIALSLFVIALGAWLRSADVRADLVCVVAVWSLAGGMVMGLLGGWTALLQSVDGRSVFQPVYVVLTEVGLGALGGGLLGVYYVRLRRRTDQLAEQRNRLDEFAGIVSHDLRNPMNVAQGHLELARQTGEDRHFEAVEDAHDRMERLVDEVLALSRRGDTVDDPTPVDLPPVARDAWTTVETPGMELRVETDRTVVSDARRLRALFENLFRNAVEHGSTSPRSGTREDAVEHGSTSSRPQADDVHQTESDAAHQKSEISEDAVEHGWTSHRSQTLEDVDEERSSGHGTASHDVVERGSSGGRLRDGSSDTAGTVVVGDFEEGFYVADDGPGIPPEDRERVFEGGYSTSPDGTGFGLAIVRRIAEAHDWRIRVTESEAGGARFEFVGADGE